MNKMTAVKLKDIEGCLVAKKVKYRSFPLEDWENGFNDAISTQGEVKITLSRDRLARNIFIKNTECPNDWEKQVDMFRQPRLRAIIFAYESADAILNALPELVEVVR